MIVALAVLAGGIGALARLVVDGALTMRLGTVGQRFPLPTLIINVSGSLLLGVLTGLVLYHGMSSTVSTIFGVGFCGGFTTFSTASYETVRLAQRGSVTAAVGTALGNAALTTGAAAVGLLITR